jgi:hypothetical protein
MTRRIVPLGLSLLLAACTVGPIVSNPSPTPITIPTATPEPLAAQVNGQGILLADYQDEVARFEAAQTLLGTDLASLGDYRRQVLQALIDRLLLTQGAVEAGRSFDEVAVDAELEAVAQARGGSEAMGAWMAENRYTLGSLKRALREDQLSAMMIEDITQSINENAEQVRAAHILVASRPEAEDRRPSSRPAPTSLNWRDWPPSTPAPARLAATWDGSRRGTCSSRRSTRRRGRWRPARPATSSKVLWAIISSGSWSG